ncbi:NAD-dependent epimerase/dehydratase family protein [Dactylosporangium roseum]|uniref:NAD-dependent epimerase/dehydratase family protein n=1 Tax=Dactylosporangium roseum TaxID=47989 RepID=A0ABY5YZH2_9ACTN|nr:NAD-dependent epimerase/dehydratase family protein [Dactylosporangium roseum]UWZ34789.1 NAD-dependent epimerase/dehydratase family protein [Dactylosporangium roseum]
MPTSLVTGGAGFIGSHVAEHLLRMGHRVLVLDDLSGGDAANVPAGAAFVAGSVCDVALVDSLFADWRFDYVYHLAAYAAEGLSHFIKRYNYNNNVLGSLNLINAAVNAETVRCFVFTSSIAVYGNAASPLTEDVSPTPIDPYGIAKYTVEQELAVTHEMFGLPYVIFRPHNVYGERQNIGDRYRNVVGIFMNQTLRDEPCTVFGDGEQTRAFSYIDDVAMPIADVVNQSQAYNQIFNIGGDIPYSLNQLAAAVSEVMGVPLRVEHMPARVEVTHAYADHRKVRSVLGIDSSPVGLEEGLRRMAAWARQHGPQEPSVFTEIEIPRNMPPSWQALVSGPV